MRTLRNATIALVVLVSVGYAQTSGIMSILSSDSIHFLVTHPSGARTGADPRRTAANALYHVTFFDEIPRANYSFSGTTDLEGTGSESHEFIFHPNTGKDEGVYTLEAIGVGLSSYWIDAHISQPANTAFKLQRLRLRGVVEKDSTVTFRFSYFTSPDSSIIMQKVINARSLLQDVAAMRKLTWISTQAIAEKYEGFVETYATQIALNKMIEAR
jgi:hypothetical protein